MKKGIIYNLSPFNNNMDMSVTEYIIKKLLAFMLIYCLSAVLGEGIIIGILYGMGYAPLHGVMPVGQIGGVLPYYGFLVFSLVTFAYWRFVEKQTFRAIGFSRKTVDYLPGALIAVIMLLVIMSVCCISGSMTFGGFNINTDIKSLIIWLLAFVIQGSAEEIMCRGFLLNSLKKRISVPLAILISSTVFAVLHLIGTTLFDAAFVYVILGIINLYLISFIFSILSMWRSNIWIACGLHSIWNFILNTIMGLSVSGNESVSGGAALFSVKETNILNGAEYGIESSIITTIVLGMSLFVMIRIWKGRIGKNGIQ